MQGEGQRPDGCWEQPLEEAGADDDEMLCSRRPGQRAADNRSGVAAVFPLEQKQKPSSILPGKGTPRRPEALPGAQRCLGKSTVPDQLCEWGDFLNFLGFSFSLAKPRLTTGHPAGVIL